MFKFIEKATNIKARKLYQLFVPKENSQKKKTNKNFKKKKKISFFALHALSLSIKF